jgi:anti-sigma-K factor RskA
VKPEPHSQADEAARYVLGQLNPKARHEFEVLLTQSAELRALVQELEEGIEATARAVPQRPPPSAIVCGD